MNATQVTLLGEELIELQLRPRQVERFSSRYPGLTAAEGYGASRRLHAARLAQGWLAVGRKIGFTNRTIWPRYGVYEPIWGRVYDRTLIRAQGGAAVVDLAGLVQPRIEPEICFGLKAPPPPSRDPQRLLACIEWVAHSVEIVQCHHPEWQLSLADSTSANGLHGRLIVGEPVAIERISGLAAALPFLRMTLKREGQVRDEGLGSNVLGSPLLALAALVEILAGQPDSPPLQAGEIISTGTLTDAHAVAPGERWSTDLHGFATRGLEIVFA